MERKIYIRLIISSTLFVIALSFPIMLKSQVAQEQIFYNHAIFWNKNEFTQIFEESPFGVGVDLIHRRANKYGEGHFFQTPLRTSVRPWIHYQIGADARLSWSPFSYHATQPYLGEEGDELRAASYEYRSTLQFFHHHKHFQGRLMHTWRYRLAFRFRMTDGNDEFTNFARFRFRYRLRYMLNAPDFYTQGVIYTAASTEIGLNMGKPVVYNTFNQNRIYLALGFRFLNAMRLELRYVDRVRSRGSGYQFDRGQGLMIALNIDQITYIGKRYTQPIKYAD